MQKGDEFALLQHGLAAGDFDQAAAGRQALDLGEDLVLRHFAAAGEGVLGVAPGAAEIASGEAHEDAGQSGEGTFPLQRFVDFDDVHSESQVSRFRRFQGLKVKAMPEFHALHICQRQANIGSIGSIRNRWRWRCRSPRW